MIETEQEMRKVSWPTLPEVWNATLVVILVTAVFALTMSLFDHGIRNDWFRPRGRPPLLVSSR